MVDITHKNSTLRTAVAQAILKVGSPETIKAITNREVPKGDVLEMAKTAGLFAVKKTSDMIPDCHPLPVEYTGVSYEIGEEEIKILMEVKTIYRTGVEVEAMHGVSVVALTMYDMLKPIDKAVEIGNIKLVIKKGGKSNFKERLHRTLKATVIVCSDSISQGIKTDKAGLAVKEYLETWGIKVNHYAVIPDEKDRIQELVMTRYEVKDDIIICCGGTGLSARDITPEALEPLIEREIPGMAETIRKYGQDRTPYAMLSRSVAGLKGETLLLGIPGSTNGAKESVQAIFPHAMHLFGIVRGARHD